MENENIIKELTEENALHVFKFSQLHSHSFYGNSNNNKNLTQTFAAPIQ
jgi:hypothetical protein